MEPDAPTVTMALRTARGEKRRIRSFLKKVEELGVEVSELPASPVKTLREAERFLQRYLDVLDTEVPTAQQLTEVLEALGGIDRVVKRAMADILKSMGWRPEAPPPGERRQKRDGSTARPGATRGSTRGAKIIPFPGPRTRGSNS
jgi:hypothetical protein